MPTVSEQIGDNVAAAERIVPSGIQIWSTAMLQLDSTLLSTIMVMPDLLKKQYKEACRPDMRLVLWCLLKA